MRNTLLKAGLAAAVILLTSSSAYAQLATANISATAAVLARGRITLTGTIDFPDTDPFLQATINANPLTVQALARVAPGASVSLTVQAGGNFVSGTDVIAINNLTWTGAGAGFAGTGTMNTTAQPVGNWSGPGANNGSQTYSLVNNWAYAPGNYSVTLTYTLTTP